MASEPEAKPPRPRRQFRFRLRTVLILTSVCCLLMGVWSAYVQPFQRQLAATKWVVALNGKITSLPAEGPDWQAWLVQRMLGDDAYFHAVGVDLNGVEVPEEAQTNLAALVFVVELSLDGSGVDDQAVNALGKANRLERLSLRYVGVTDEGLKPLSLLPSLRHLRLTGARVTDEGLARLAECPGLEELYIRWTDVTPAGVESFREQRPDCVVHYHASPGAASASSVPVAPPGRGAASPRRTTLPTR